MSGPERFAALDVRAVETLLCDADGNLFPSEEPAFEASTEVTNRLLAERGVPARFAPAELRARALGRNFRATAADLLAEAGVAIEPEELEEWVAEERRQVVAHLGAVLRPDPEVQEPLAQAQERFGLALVSSSALSRVGTCLAATDLEALFPPAARYSAEDSLPVPTSKPDPAVYRHAGQALGLAGAAGLAVEDAEAGVRSAAAAGFPVVGNLQFVPAEERPERERVLRAAGAAAVVSSWRELLAELA